MKTNSDPTVKKNNPKPAIYVLPYLCITVITGLIYFHTLKFPADKLDEDTIILKHKPILENPHNLIKVLTTDAFYNDPPSRFYRPLQNLSFYVDTQISGGRIKGYRLTALAIHILTCFALFFLLSLTGTDRILSFLCSMLFAIHPLFIQAVVWLPSRGDLLLGLTGILSLIFFHRYMTKGGAIHFICHGIMFLLAICSKESALLLPLIYAIYWFFIIHKKPSGKSFLPLLTLYFVLTILFLTARYFFVAKATADQFGFSVFIENLRTLPETTGKFFLPLSLCPMPFYTATNTIIGLAWIAIIALIILMTGKRTGFPLRMAGPLFFILLTLPAMAFRHGMADIGYDYLEQRAYLPSAGLVFFAAGALSPLFQKSKKSVSLIFSFLVALFALWSFINSFSFKDAETFYSRVIIKNPRCAMAYNNLGIMAGNQGDNKKALKMFNRSIAISSNNYLAFFNRGIIRNESGDYHGAIEDYSQAIALKPGMAEIYNNRSNAFFKLSEFHKAYLDLNTAIKINPRYGKAYFNRGITCFCLGMNNEAFSDWKKAASLGIQQAEALLKETCQ